MFQRIAGLVILVMIEIRADALSPTSMPAVQHSVDHFPREQFQVPERFPGLGREDIVEMVSVVHKYPNLSP
jgi:hypothetical protein